MFDYLKCKYVSKLARFFSKGADSNVWLSRQLSDPYVKRSRIESFRCRSAFKLIELDTKYKLLYPGITVLDCGAAPGSWSQVISRKCFVTNSASSLAIAIDKNFFQPIEHIICLSECDINSDSTISLMKEKLGTRKFNLVLSDMAPNASGIKDIDKHTMNQLNQMALKVAIENSCKGASFLFKMWSDMNSEKHLKDLILRFYKSVKIVKPPASRSDSSEIFLLCQGFGE